MASCLTSAVLCGCVAAEAAVCPSLLHPSVPELVNAAWNILQRHHGNYPRANPDDFDIMDLANYARVCALMFRCVL